MSIYIKNSNILEKYVGGEKILYNPNKNTVYSLNITAAIIWDLCLEGLSEDEIIIKIRNKYDDAPQDIGNDVKNTLSNFCSVGLLHYKESEM